MALGDELGIRENRSSAGSSRIEILAAGLAATIGSGNKELSILKLSFRKRHYRKVLNSTELESGSLGSCPCLLLTNYETVGHIY